MLFNQERKLKDSIGLDARVILTVNYDILGCLDTIWLWLVYSKQSQHRTSPGMIRTSVLIPTRYKTHYVGNQQQSSWSVC